MSAEMWALAAQRFKEGPASNGSDEHYEKGKAEQKSGRDTVDKQRLTALARRRCAGRYARRSASSLTRRCFVLLIAAAPHASAFTPTSKWPTDA